MSVEDKFKEMFKAQETLQRRICKERGFEFGSQEYLNTMTLGLIAEAIESHDWTAWKVWKQNGVEYDKKKHTEELADTLHFFIGLCNGMGITSDELYELFMKKIDVNHKRQDDGY